MATNANTIYVTSASNHTIVMHIPEMLISKTWTKRGQRYPFDREQLVQAYYHASVEYLFKQGMLTTDDKDFLKEVGLMDEEEHTEIVTLTDALMMRIIKHMPVSELKKTLGTLSRTQLTEVGEYAVEHYQDLNMDRIDILTKATGKNILKAIDNYKKAQEE